MKTDGEKVAITYLLDQGARPTSINRHRIATVKKPPLGVGIRRVFAVRGALTAHIYCQPSMVEKFANMFEPKGTASIEIAYGWPDVVRHGTCLRYSITANSNMFLSDIVARLKATIHRNVEVATIQETAPDTLSIELMVPSRSHAESFLGEVLNEYTGSSMRTTYYRDYVGNRYSHDVWVPDSKQLGTRQLLSR